MDNPAFTSAVVDNEVGRQSRGPTLNVVSNGKTESTKQVELIPELGFFSAVGMIIGTVIGSGIFVSPKGVLLGSGSVALSLIIWVACGILSFAAALAYAELGTRIVDNGGTYVYLLEGFASDRKTKHSWWRPLLAFLYNWQSVLIVNPAKSVIKMLVCAEYLTRLSVPGCANWASFEAPRVAVKLIAAALLIIITAVNCYSVQLAAKVQNVFMISKLLAFAFIIVGGIIMISQGHVQELQRGFQGTTTDFSDIASAFYSGLWAYNGWQAITDVTKEMKRPGRDLPRASILANLIVTVCYVFVIISYLTTMSANELLASETVAVGFGSRVAGFLGESFMIITVAFSTFGSTNGTCFTNARLCHRAAREGHLPKGVSYIHKDFLTPTPAILFYASLALLMVLPGSVVPLINAVGFLTWLFIGTAMIALIGLKRSGKHATPTVEIPWFVPVIVLMMSVFLVVTPLVGNPRFEYLFCVVFIILGILLYIPFVHFNVTLFKDSSCVGYPGQRISLTTGSVL